MKEKSLNNSSEKWGLYLFYITGVMTLFMYIDNVSMLLRGGMMNNFTGYNLLGYSIFILNILTAKFFLITHPEIKTLFKKILMWVFIIYFLFFILIIWKVVSNNEDYNLDIFLYLMVLWVYPIILRGIISKIKVTTDE